MDGYNNEGQASADGNIAGITVASRLATFAGPAHETGLTVRMIAEPAVVWRAAGALGNQPHRSHDPQLTADHET